LEKYFVSLTGPRAPQLPEGLRLGAGTVARVSSVGEVEEVFDHLIRDGLRGTGASNTLCAVLSEYLLVKLSELMMPTGERPSRRPARSGGAANTLRPTSTGSGPWSRIAAECDINQAYLCRLFRRFDHEGPYRYLLRLKMNFAAERLRDPRCS
jgi:AraC-like DNA-binding protein